MARKNLLVLFNLKPDQSVEAYEQWAREVDLPTVRALPSIDSFRVFRSNGLFAAEGTPPYQYGELIEIADEDQFFSDISNEKMQAIAAQFNAFADIVFVDVTELEPIG